MTIREQIEQILKSEKREFWIYPEERCDVDGTLLGCSIATSIDQIPDEFKAEALALRPEPYVSKLESLVRLLPGAVDALEHYKGITVNDKSGLHKEGTDALTKVARAALANIEKEVGKL